jgi:hypothetical protein
LDLRKELLGKNDVSTLEAISKLGFLLNRLGEYSQAEKWCRQAIELRKAVLGLKDKGILISIGFLASVLSNQAKLNKTAKLNQQVLA